MSKYHRLAFMSHISSLFWLFIATVIGLGCMLGFQTYVLLSVMWTYENTEYGLGEHEFVKASICVNFGKDHFTFVE